MKTSESQTTLIAAMLAARQAFTPILKSKTGQSGNRTFKYTPLDEVFDVVLPPLWANGLLLTQAVEGHELVTRLEHVSGEWRESRMPINAEHANMQSYGIELTYRRRYAIQPMLGIITEEDTDAEGSQKRKGGKDFTRPQDAGGVISGPGEAYRALSADWQAWVDDVAVRAENTAATSISESVALIDDAIASEQIDDPGIKAAIWSKLSSRTRAAIKAHTTAKAA